MNFSAGTYAAQKKSGSVTDIVLSNTPPTYNLDSAFIVGTFLMVVFIAFITFRRLNTVPFIALFAMPLRSVRIEASSRVRHRGGDCLAQS